LFAAIIDPARAEAIYRDECAKAVAEQLEWLDDDEACTFLRGMTRRTWLRKRVALGIPFSDVDGRKLYLRQDLEALLLSHTTAPGTTVIAFPSMQMRELLPPSAQGTAAA
jgi:hypothetical protein